MKILLNFSILLNIFMQTQAQNELNRIGKSNFFSNGTKVFYVLSNKFNSSGFLSEYKASDTLLISNLDIEKIFDKKPTLNTTIPGIHLNEEKMFDNKAFIISKDVFVEKYDPYFQYKKHMTPAIEIPDINLNEFKIVSKNYASFKNAIFYKFSTIKKADPLSFRVIIDKHYESLSKDATTVFFQEKTIPFANPKTFKILEQGYAKDDNYVFKKDGKIIPNADPKTFQILTYTYQKDKNKVFKLGEPTSIDVESFKILTYNYYKNKVKNSLYAIDKNHVYFQGEIIPDAVAQTFHIIASEKATQLYATDENNVYYLDKKLTDADAQTFKMNTNNTSDNCYDAKDKNYLYNRDKKTRINKASKK